MRQSSTTLFVSYPYTGKLFRTEFSHIAFVDVRYARVYALCMCASHANVNVKCSAAAAAAATTFHTRLCAICPRVCVCAVYMYWRSVCLCACVPMYLSCTLHFSSNGHIGFGIALPVHQSQRILGTARYNFFSVPVFCVFFMGKSTPFP